MRRRQALAALIVSSALALSACGSDDGGDGDTTASTDLGVEVSGAPGEKPTLTIPDEDPPEDLQVEVIDAGDGPEVGENDVVVANYLGQTWDPRPPASDTPAEPPADGETPPPADGETTPPAEGDVGGTTTPEDEATDDSGADAESGDAEPYVFDNSYDRGAAASFSLNQVIEGWKEGLTGQSVGSRVLLSIPPDQGYGAQEGHDLQNDTLVFVVEIVDSIDPTAHASGEAVTDVPEGLPTVTDNDGAAPTIDFEGATPPEASDSTLVINGDGDEVGANLVVNMVQASYPDGADIITTWDEGQAPLTLAAEQLAGIPGLAEALTGATVGSRVVSRISAADNVGPDGSEGSPLVLVIDVIGSY